MCLSLTKDSARLKKNLRRRKKPIIAYKIVDSDMKSGYRGFQWKTGLNISDRESTNLTVEEARSQTVHKGFHLALQEPDDCRHLCQCQYRRLYRRLCQRPYRCLRRYNRVLKCKIKPEDVIAIGEWGSIPSIVATKAVVEEI